MKGLLCELYACQDFPRDTLSVIPENVKYVIIPELSGPFEASEDKPELTVVRRMIAGKEYIHLEPTKERKEGKWLMFGGRFVWTSDSRFRNVFNGPIPLHDRYEK